MAAATTPRNTPTIARPDRAARAMASNARVIQGTIVALNAAGLAVPAITALNLVADGMASETTDNTGGADGALKVEVRKGTFRFASAGGADLIGRTEIGKTVFLVDNQTLAKTDGGGTRSPAGKVFDVDANGVWITF